MTTVMVAGAWDEQSAEVLAAAEAIGKAVAGRAHSLITGGGSGVAAHAAAGAAGAGGTTVAVIGQTRTADGEAELNSAYSLRMYTDSGWDGRSIVAVKSADVLVVVGGKIGTLIEVATAYLHKVPVIVLRASSDLVVRLEAFALDGYLDDRENVRINFADTVEEVLALLDQKTAQNVAK
ncbi:hypothetical protein AB0F44_25765 [Nocardioides sp. NPDC023903]|uniref:SLOG cluster 4 domain-containing protein n=1 Tax=Nocardioides sp. NPDC023903 TaxID=3157195 RepID=UPI0033DFC50C